MNMFNSKSKAQNIKGLIAKVYKAAVPNAKDIEGLLSVEDARELETLFAFADRVRKEFMGEGIFLRGIIEFSNRCKNNCFYCGLNVGNKEVTRYTLTKNEIFESVKVIAKCDIKTVVLQSGEDDELDAEWLADIIERIKAKFDLAITLSVGERTLNEYKMWKRAGADRYLLKIETTDKKLYGSLHPEMSFENRLNCLCKLKELGYQVGSGTIVGLRGQTLGSIAKDIIFFKERDFDMIGIGPFIPHKKTRLGDEKKADKDLTLKAVALTRILTKNSHLPATTALGSLDEDHRIAALRAGANVLMPNFTPQAYRRLYEIYPGKRCIDEPVGSCVSCLKKAAGSIGRFIDYSKGDSLKREDRNV